MQNFVSPRWNKNCGTYKRLVAKKKKKLTALVRYKTYYTVIIYAYISFCIIIDDFVRAVENYSRSYERKNIKDIRVSRSVSLSRQKSSVGRILQRWLFLFAVPQLEIFGFSGRRKINGLVIALSVCISEKLSTVSL